MHIGPRATRVVAVLIGLGVLSGWLAYGAGSKTQKVTKVAIATPAKENPAADAPLDTIESPAATEQPAPATARKTGSTASAEKAMTTARS